MSEVKVSIIMPVYNAEKYLRDTLESVKNQTFKDFELVVVNDGSSDSSVQIISEYYDKINIRLINQNNSGVSTARNVGIAEAKGMYIGFLDADDIMHPDFFAIMYESIIKLDADLVFCEYIPFYGTCKFNQIHNSYIKLEKIKSDQNKSAFDYMMEIGLGAALWNKLVKKSVITKYNIQFNPNSTFGEDMFFNWKCVLTSVNVIWVKECLYGYRQSTEGATFRYHSNLYGKYLDEYDHLRFFCERNNIYLESIEKSIKANLVQRLPALLRMCIRSKGNIIKKYTDVKELVDKQEIQEALLQQYCEKNINNNLCSQFFLYKKYFKVLIYGFYIEYRFRIARNIKYIKKVVLKLC